MSCPSDPNVCGPSHTLTPDADGNFVKVNLDDSTNAADFIFGQICNYEVVWPEGSEEADQLVISVATLPENVSLIATLGDEKQLGKDVRVAKQGGTVRVDYP